MWLFFLLSNVSGLTTSGLSSGGFFSTQFQVAYSSIVTGAGVIAGGPYYCSNGSEITAITSCMTKPAEIDMSQIFFQTEQASSAGQIDDISNLKSSKIWIFSGTLDTVVHQGVVQNTLLFYQKYSNPLNITSIFNIPAEHSWVTNGFGGLCQYLGTPYINNCNVDASGDLLQSLLGPLNTRVFAVDQNLHVFKQSLYGDIVLAGMLELGYIYIPENCLVKNCRVHIAFHGCLQSAQLVGNIFVKWNGLNDWAESNNIIVIYPQIISSFVNPQGCWDFWGYTGTNFAFKTGRQMQIVYNISQKLPIVNWK